MSRGDRTVHGDIFVSGAYRAATIITLLCATAGATAGATAQGAAPPPAPSPAAVPAAHATRPVFDSGDPRGGLDAEAKAALMSLLDMKEAQQAEVLARVRAAVDAVDSPLLRSLRGYRDRARAKFKPRLKAMPRHANWKDRKGGDPAILKGLRFPVASQYLFGQGSIGSVDEVVGQAEVDRIAAAAAKARNKRVKARVKRRAKRGKGPLEAPAYLQVRAMLRGYPPDLDLCLAGILRELDNDRAADRFAAFLEGWRNGPESFYRALDRTAGTKDSVFFYDAMLGDYIGKFVPKSHADYKTIRRSTRAAHDALHDSFLAYRQYRALRECIALTMLLPPDARLPGSLARYEAVHHEMYSVREMLTLLLHTAGQDIDEVVRLVTESAPPLREHLWTAPYDPFPPLNKAFDDRIAQLTSDRHSDAILKEQRERRAELGRKCAAAARTALLAALTSARR